MSQFLLPRRADSKNQDQDFFPDLEVYDVDDDAQDQEPRIQNSSKT